MAFMCPIRIGRSRKKKERQEKLSAPTIGRITGSASIETLVRVGLEKEQGLSANSRVVVVHDFTPCVDDELGVRRGQIVHTLYQENDWVYVISEDGCEEGFVPQSYCAAFGTPLANTALNITKKPSDRSEDHTQSSLESSMVQSDAESGTSSCCTEVHPFFKDPAGRYLVLYTFVARDENDLSVERGELVTVLNREDPDWFWVLRSDNQEGFVPSAFVYPADVIEAHTRRPQEDSRRPLDDGDGPTNGNSVNKEKEFRYEIKSGTVTQNTYHNGEIINLVKSGLLDNSTPPLTSGASCASGSVPTSTSMAIVNSNSNHGIISNSNSSNNHSQSNQNDILNHSSNNILVDKKTNSQHATVETNSNSSRNSIRETPDLRASHPSTPGEKEMRSASGAGGSSIGGADLREQYRAHGTELVMLYDYRAQAADDLDVKRGEWIYADLNCQTVEGWLWAFSPRLSKYGFIPKAYARPPAMTSL